LKLIPANTSTGWFRKKCPNTKVAIFT